MPSSVRNAAVRAVASSDEPAAANSRSTARAPITVSRATAASRVVASAEFSLSMSVAISVEADARVATEES
jgi:hypothetical protein